VLECAKDPAAFPDGVPTLFFWEDSSLAYHVPKGWKHQHPPVEAWAVAIRNATNDEVRMFALFRMPYNADRALQKEYLWALNLPSPKVQYAAAKRLAQFNNDHNHMPPETQLVKDSAGARIVSYPNLDRTVAYWKEFLSKN
jgi:hypothetical protein